MKTTFFEFCVMLMKPPAPAIFGPNLLTFTLPKPSICGRRKQQPTTNEATRDGCADLGEAEDGDVDAAAVVVEVEHRRLVDDGVVVDARAEVEAAEQEPAYRPWL